MSSSMNCSRSRRTTRPRRTQLMARADSQFVIVRLLTLASLAASSMSIRGWVVGLDEDCILFAPFVGVLPHYFRLAQLTLAACRAFSKVRDWNRRDSQKREICWGSVLRFEVEVFKAEGVGRCHVSPRGSEFAWSAWRGHSRPFSCQFQCSLHMKEPLHVITQSNERPL